MFTLHSAGFGSERQVVGGAGSCARACGRGLRRLRGLRGLMGDLAKGVTEFRKGLRDTPDEEKSTTSQSTAALNEGASRDNSTAREDERTGG